MYRLTTSPAGNRRPKEVNPFYSNVGSRCLGLLARKPDKIECFLLIT